MHFDLDWVSSVARHRDSLVASKLNLWRDLFPPALEARVMNQPVGSQVSHRFSPGELTATWQERLLFRVASRQFDRRFTRRGLVQPRNGRFYPRGILEGVAGVFRDDRHPFRIVESAAEQLRIDLNHPLAEHTVDLTLTIEEIWAPGEERGGRCNDIAELLAADGPGMQARWKDRPTDFWSDLPFMRQDPRADAEFYRGARLVDHLDSAAIGEISALYGRLLPRGGRILDLMASWHSHLPADLAPAHLAGLGLNAEELAANAQLHQRTVHDLNADPRLPYPDGAFDAVVCTVSVEYLTQPLEVFAEAARVLRPGGLLVVSFSNRWFPTKVVRIWEGIHEFERPGLVIEYFLTSDRYRDLQTWSLRGLPRPADDKYADQLALSDPLYAVWGTRA
jgi:SAM-dependent methyltransferase